MSGLAAERSRWIGVGCLIVLAACAGETAARRPAPVPGDWTTVYVGVGPVTAYVKNESANSVTLRVRAQDGAIVGQTSLPAHGDGTLHLPTQTLLVYLRMSNLSGFQHYRGPTLDIPRNARTVELRLTAASFSNLAAITEQEFNR